MDESLKHALVERFRAQLDGLDAPAAASDAAAAGEDAGTDLLSLFVELAALRSEVRTESRLVKDALDLFRGVVERAEAEREAAAREAERVRAAARERERALLRPLLLDLLDLRDRMAAGLAGGGTAVPARSWPARLFRRRPAAEFEAWREGLGLTLARFDRLLGDRSVVPIAALVGRPFDPRRARAVGTVCDPQRDNGIVVDVVRPGFLWADEVLRTAEVVVNRTDREEEAAP